jgi:hypothetical protein
VSKWSNFTDSEYRFSIEYWIPLANMWLWKLNICFQIWWKEKKRVGSYSMCCFCICYFGINR